MAEGLERFLAAQDPVWPRVVTELAEGRKQSHWMWFVFPQIAGLGRSAMAVRHALASRAEAAAYLAHPVLGARLRETTDLMLDHAGVRAEAILGGIDAVKLRSSMTLFHAAAPSEQRFAHALAVFFAEAGDPRTLEILAEQEGTAETERGSADAAPSDSLRT